MDRTEQYRRYDTSEKGRARRRRYNQSAKGKARATRYSNSEKGRETKQRYEEANRYSGLVYLERLLKTRRREALKRKANRRAES